MTETLDAPPPPGPEDRPEAGPSGDGRGQGEPARAPLPAALHAALARIEQAAADPDPVEMVHDARKGMKEYRALLRLVGGNAARAARRHTAEVARGFAHARDRATAQEALQLLEESGLVLACDLQAARAAVGADPDADAAGLRAAVLDFLADARLRLDAGLEAEAAAADLVAGLKRGYGAARRGRLGNAAALHETRKRVVAHRYQMSFLASAWAGRGATRAGRAQRLRDVLGAHQDLETLRPMLHAAAPALGEGALQRLELAMARLQKRLRRHARHQHRALFHASSRHFARKMAARLGAEPAA